MNRFIYVAALAPGPIKFTTSGSGFVAINPQAAVYWNPANTAKGSYTLQGNFTLLKPSDHTNYYGLVFGGSDLDGPMQTYLYFLVAQDGTWLIKHRSGGTEPREVVPKTRNAAVRRPDATGMSTNALEVRVMPDKIDYVVNGTVVHSTPKSGATASADGLYGFRVNHRLEVKVDNFGIARP
jgi:hypothetical protein